MTKCDKAADTKWEKTADYYERLANLHGRDPYSHRALLWYAETCRARTDFGESPPQANRPAEAQPPVTKIRRWNWKAAT